MKLDLFTRWRGDAINLAALTCLQASNAVIPLLIVPLAIVRLGAGAYAHVAIAEAISMIAVAAVLYSFEVDGVSRIIGFGIRSHRAELSTVLSTILFARLLIFAAVSTTLMAGTFLFTALDPALLACWLLVPFGQVFHSYWFYQGIESNVPPAMLTFAARLSSLVLIATCVHSAEDSVLVPLAVGAPFAIAGLLSATYKIRSLNMQIGRTSHTQVFAYLGQGRRIFLGTAAVMLYREINVLLMGLAGVPAAAISSYSLAEKGIKMVQAVSRPLTQIAFPKVLRALGHVDRPERRAAQIIARYTIPQMAVLAAAMAFLWLSVDHLVILVPSLARFQHLPDIGLMLVILAPAPLFGIANFMLGSAGLNYLGSQDYYLRAILATGLASVAACFLLSTLIGAVGAAICFVGAEFTLLMLVVRRYVTERPRLTESKSGD